MADSRDQLALAADVPLADGVALYREVQAHVGVAKVGLSLYVEHGPAAVQAFAALGARVFLDLKLHDIPNTVQLASARAAAQGVAYLTIHASGGLAMMQAAVIGVREGAAAAKVAPPKVLAVTVLTSLDGPALVEVGLELSPQTQVARLAALAKRAGVDGVVCSPLEAKALRTQLGPNFLLCTPGIRPHGTEAGDQARAETPGTALAAGSDLLVVGRPIYAAADPVEAARMIAAAIGAHTR